LRIWRPLSILFCLQVFIGCASIDISDYRQTVLVKSDPPGAAIFDQGEQVGVTPAYVRVRRRGHPQLTLEMPGEASRKVDLRTHYRWWDSFGANFLWLTLAPVGWLTDWATGTAWYMDDPGQIRFAGVRKGPLSAKALTVAIAPPELEEEGVRDAVGSVLEDRMKSVGRYRVLDYDKTVLQFAYYDSEQGLSEKKTRRYNLYYELKADRVLISNATLSPEGFRIRSRLLNVYTGQSEGDYRWDVLPRTLADREEMSTYRKYSRYFHILPNTAYVNFSSFSSTLDVDGRSYSGSSARGTGFGDKALDYLSALSVGRLSRPRSGQRGRWVFEFTPTGAISKKKLRFLEHPDLRDVTFERWYVKAGYGAEMGYLSRVGFFYFDFMPAMTWSSIDFKTKEFEERLSRNSLSLILELGYSCFLGSHLVGKVYVRSVGEDRQLWERAVRDATGDANNVTAVSSSFAGIAIGYYFPAVFGDRSEDWRVIQRRSQ
jgi:hypothetical protein